MQQSPSQSPTQPKQQPTPQYNTQEGYTSTPGYIVGPYDLYKYRQTEVPLAGDGQFDAKNPQKLDATESIRPDAAPVRSPLTSKYYPADRSRTLQHVKGEQYNVNLKDFMRDALTVPGHEDRSAAVADTLASSIGNARRNNLQASGYDTKGLFNNAADLALPITLGGKFTGHSGDAPPSHLFEEHSPALQKLVATGSVPVNIHRFSDSGGAGSHWDPNSVQANLFSDEMEQDNTDNAQRLFGLMYSDNPLNYREYPAADYNTLLHEITHANHNNYYSPEVKSKDGRYKDILTEAFGIRSSRAQAEEEPNYTHYSPHEFLRSLRVGKEAFARHLTNTTNLTPDEIVSRVQDPNAFREFLSDLYSYSPEEDPYGVSIPSTATQRRNEVEVYRAIKGLKPAFLRMKYGPPKIEAPSLWDRLLRAPENIWNSSPDTYTRGEGPLKPEAPVEYSKDQINSIFDTVWPQVNNTTSQGRGIDKMAALSTEKGASNEGFNKQASPLIDLITHAAPIYAAAKSLPALKYGWHGLKHGLKMEHGGKLSRQLKNTFSQGANWAARGSELLPNYLGNAIIRPAVMQARMWAVNAPTPVRKAINKAVTLRAAGANKLRGADPHAYNPGKAVKHSLFDLITNQIPGAEAVRALFTRKFRNQADTSGYTLAMNDAMRRLYNS